MKRFFWITIVIGMFLLAACTGRPAVVSTETPVVPTATAPVVTATAEPQPTDVPPAAIPVTGSTQAPVEPAPAKTDASPLAQVSADGLNLRVGPGLNYRILSVLAEGETVQLMGRSQDSEWMNVRTQGGQDGWVYGAYLSTGYAISSLPVLEAFGGPLAAQPEPETAPTKPARYSFNVVIENNIATVTMTGLPANRDIALRLSARDGGQSMTVASGSTDAGGAAVMVFEMPDFWPDGSAVTQSRLVLGVETADGSINRSVNITYFSGQ